MTRSFIIVVLLFSLLSKFSYSQTPTNPVDGKNSVNTITTAVPFLMITPDSRAGGMGDVGVATTPDANSLHWNPAKLGFVEKDFGVSISYTPWLRELIGDMSLSYLAAYKRLDSRQVIGFGLRYFSLGSMKFTDENGIELKDYSPNEFAIDLAYSLLLSKNLSGSISLRFIYSNLTGGIATSSGIATHAGTSFAGDLGLYYTNQAKIFEKDGSYAFGLCISNMGAKISYTDAQQNFIPTNLRFGGRVSINFDDYNSISFSTEFNKLMVPTPPVYDQNHPNDPNYIIKGKNPNVSVPTGMIQSFYDAPEGMSEEFREINISAGIEYWYSKQFAIRTGYFHEDETKGNRKFFTVGLGMKLNIFSLDFAYLIPSQQHNPLQNTLRFTLGFNFEPAKPKKKDEK